MNKPSTLHIRKSIQREEFDYPLLSHLLSSYSGKRQKINALLKSKAIIRVKKGLYVFGEDYRKNPICKESLANLIYGPSYVSLEYALSFYNLIPERVENVTSVTTGRDKNFATSLGNFSYKHLGSNKFNKGISLVSIDSLHSVLMASPEKALADYIHFHKVRELKSISDAKDFIENDLRIPSQNFNHFSPLALGRINRIYKIKSLEKVIEFFEGVRK